jgi:hypothetical protein
MPDYIAEETDAPRLRPRSLQMSATFKTVNRAGKPFGRAESHREELQMSEWKVHYRDDLDHDRISQSLSSKDAALAQARNLHRDRRAEIYKIEGPAGDIVPKDDVMRWVSAHRWH